jgi:recombination protein RecA
MYGSPETTTGGNALKFYASVRLDIRRTGAIKDREEVVGNATRVKVVKNKVAPPFKQVEFDIMYGEGISKMGELVDLGVKAGVVEKSGAWFSYDSQRLGQGRENAKTFLKQNPDAAARIEMAIRENAGHQQRLGCANAWKIQIHMSAYESACRRMDNEIPMLARHCASHALETRDVHV